MTEPIRRCRPLLRRSQHHTEHDALGLATNLYRGKWIATEAGVFSPALAKYMLESGVQYLVDTGVAVRLDDPEGFPTFMRRVW